ncbi:MAG: poly-gamma-glutamate hydrolase family protein [Pseudomonadota bacterium]
MDKYSNFYELKQKEREGEDYVVLCREAESMLAIMAPHGGGIEPGTGDIADALAGSDYTFYAFKGIKKTGNKILHISSNRHDEPLGLKIAKNKVNVISIHGSQNSEEIVFVGGKNQELKQKIMDDLNIAGFKAVVDDLPGLCGLDPDNICNRCKSGQGVQLEISRGIRNKMFENIDNRLLRNKMGVFYKFVDAIKESLLTLNI